MYIYIYKLIETELEVAKFDSLLSDKCCVHMVTVYHFTVHNSSSSFVGLVVDI